MRYTLFIMTMKLLLNNIQVKGGVQAFSSFRWEHTAPFKLSRVGNVPSMKRSVSTSKDDGMTSSDSLSTSKSLPNYMERSSFPDWAFESRDYFRYELIYQSKKSMARVGRIHTPHGIIDTPGYVAVATNGALKVRTTKQTAVK